MYINDLVVKNFRTFREARVAFIHPDRSYREARKQKQTLHETSDDERERSTRKDRRSGPPDLALTKRPKFPNMNLLLGNNGLGKTTLLKAVALAALGPAVGRSGIYPYRLIRREPTRGPRRPGQLPAAELRGTFTAHEQDHVPTPLIESLVGIEAKGDLETFEWKHKEDKEWFPIYSEESDAFFVVGYGATRRVERERVDPAQRKSRTFARAQRVQSLFEEAYSLVPLNAWLPRFKKNKGRYVQVVHLINLLMGSGHYRFTGDLDKDEYLFEKGGLRVPFPALSDGYRAYLGWVGDLLYHVAKTCPPGKTLVDNRGIVMVDEIDLHLHPKWQLDVLPTLSKVLPKVQFIVTSHSPLVVGSLEWMNILVMQPGSRQSSTVERLPQAVHGLDADQVLLTDFFGLDTTRAPGRTRQLKTLSMRARKGEPEAAEQLLKEMSKGAEDDVPQAAGGSTEAATSSEAE